MRFASSFVSFHEGKHTMRMMIIYIAALAGALAFRPVSAQQKVFMDAGFETGRIQRSGGTVDAFWVMSMPDPQPAGECSFIAAAGDGGFDAGSRTDVRVVKSEVWKDETVRPRAGAYFVRNVIHRNKCYPNDAPRSHLVLTTPAQEYLWDEEIWVGFSVYVPRTWEHDNKYKTDDQAHLSGISVFASNASAASSHLSLRIHPSATSDFNEWTIKLVSTDATSITDKSSTFHSIGSIVPDLGKWTDFVFRIRFNPFSRRTNPAQEGISGARDQWYEGNRGILQVWKSSGNADSSGDRPMNLVFSQVNQPLGVVPRADRGLRLIFDMYKYSWQTFDTDPEGPIFMGYDEIRYGRTARDGTGFADVAPSGTPLTSDAVPEPPTLSVN